MGIFKKEDVVRIRRIIAFLKDYKDIIKSYDGDIKDIKKKLPEWVANYKFPMTISDLTPNKSNQWSIASSLYFMDKEFAQVNVRPDINDEAVDQLTDSADEAIDAEVNNSVHDFINESENIDFDVPADAGIAQFLTLLISKKLTKDQTEEFFMKRGMSNIGSGITEFVTKIADHIHDNNFIQEALTKTTEVFSPEIVFAIVTAIIILRRIFKSSDNEMEKTFNDYYQKYLESINLLKNGKPVSAEKVKKLRDDLNESDSVISIVGHILGISMNEVLRTSPKGYSDPQGHLRHVDEKSFNELVSKNLTNSIENNHVIDIIKNLKEHVEKLINSFNPTLYSVTDDRYESFTRLINLRINQSCNKAMHQSVSSNEKVNYLLYRIVSLKNEIGRMSEDDSNRAEKVKTYNNYLLIYTRISMYYFAFIEEFFEFEFNRPGFFFDNHLKNTANKHIDEINKNLGKLRELLYKIAFKTKDTIDNAYPNLDNLSALDYIRIVSLMDSDVYYEDSTDRVLMEEIIRDAMIHHKKNIHDEMFELTKEYSSDYDKLKNFWKQKLKIDAEIIRKIKAEERNAETKA